MRFHALLPVRDEGDIIGQSLRHLLTWADSVFVFDTGSCDDTWDVVQTFAAADSRVKPVSRKAVYFNDTIVRAWLFEQARASMKDGDWFARVDADEFYHSNPRKFIASSIRPCESVVYYSIYNFQLTASEVAAWYEGRETTADRVRPIESRRRYFTITDYAEPRFCRYRRTMQWSPDASFPYNAGYVARARIPMRHYSYRDPDQLIRRVQIRAFMMSDESNRRVWQRPDLHHWSQAEWSKFIVPDELPGLRKWEAGTELPENQSATHLRPFAVRLCQRMIHAALLPILDRSRPKWPASAAPQPLPSPDFPVMDSVH
jgi:glycosyltransferase involved in cell wall biosynthesis